MEMDKLIENIRARMKLMRTGDAPDGTWLDGYRAALKQTLVDALGHHEHCPDCFNNSTFDGKRCDKCGWSGQIAEVQSPVLAWKVDMLDLSVRTSNCLRSAKIETVAQLVRYSKTQLRGIRMFGNTSLREVQRKLHERGLHLTDADATIQKEKGEV